ncbi:MAG: hypothetical protein Q9183_006253 [Haloplaca sp. 2 TL-2023]
MSTKDKTMKDHKDSVPVTASDQKRMVSPQNIEGHMSAIEESPADGHGADSFPFERLPLELREMVIQNFNLSERRLPLDLRQKGKPGPARAMSEARNLLLVSKSMANMVKPMIKKDSIIVFRFGGHYDNFRKGWTRVLDFMLYYNLRDGIPHHASFPNVQQLKETRNFEFDLVGFDPSGVKYEWMGKVSPKQNPNLSYEDCHHRREQVRFVCDALATFSPDIRHLTVRIPCGCYFGNRGLIDEVSEKIADLLSPLRRLHVKGPVTFCLKHYGIGRCGPRKGARKIHQKSLVQKLEASLGRLTGEPLSKAEQDWMTLKTIPLPKDRPSRRLATGKLYDLLKILHERPIDFEEEAKVVRRYLDTV